MTNDTPHPAGPAGETPEQRHTRHQAQHKHDLTILTTDGETGWWDEEGRPAPWPADFFDHDTRWRPNITNTTHSRNI
jgi:hypothetical protein